jgi:methyl-accepting chemotaxis protein
MSIKLDELRKRLLQQRQQGEDATNDTLTTASGPQPADPLQQPNAPERIFAKPDLRPVESANPVESAVVKTLEIGLSKDRERPAAIKREEPAAVAPPSTARPAIPSLPKLDGLTNQDQLAESVAKLFEQTKTFQARFDELAQAIDLIERMTDSATRLFGPLRAFHSQLSQLAVSFESMRAFQGQLAQLGKTFEPMRILHDQLAQLSDGIQQQVAQLVKSLDPAKDFRDRITTLARSMEQASELQSDFGELYSAFRSGNGEGSDSVEKDPEPRQRAIS